MDWLLSPLKTNASGLPIDRVHADAVCGNDRYLPAGQGNPGDDGDQSSKRACKVAENRTLPREPSREMRTERADMDDGGQPPAVVRCFLGYFVSAPSNQDLSAGAGAAPACLATILPSTMTINVGTA
jgi:hypothetical protein